MSIGSVSSGGSAYVTANQSPMEMLKAQMKKPGPKLVVKQASESDFGKWAQSGASHKGQNIDIKV